MLVSDSTVNFTLLLCRLQVRQSRERTFMHTACNVTSVAGCSHNVNTTQVHWPRDVTSWA
jgi:hypothetical protein